MFQSKMTDSCNLVECVSSRWVDVADSVRVWMCSTETLAASTVCLSLTGNVSGDCRQAAQTSDVRSQKTMSVGLLKPSTTMSVSRWHVVASNYMSSVGLDISSIYDHSLFHDVISRLAPLLSFCLLCKVGTLMP